MEQRKTVLSDSDNEGEDDESYSDCSSSDAESDSDSEQSSCGGNDLEDQLEEGNL